MVWERTESMQLQEKSWSAFKKTMVFSSLSNMALLGCIGKLWKWSEVLAEWGMHPVVSESSGRLRKSWASWKDWAFVPGRQCSRVEIQQRKLPIAWPFLCFPRAQITVNYRECLVRFSVLSKFGTFCFWAQKWGGNHIFLEGQYQSSLPATDLLLIGWETQPTTISLKINSKGTCFCNTKKLKWFLICWAPKL